MTIKHLLSMSSGVAYETWMTPEWIRDHLSAPFIHKPGTDFLYNNAPATMLAAVIRKKTRLSLEDMKLKKLF